MVITLGIYLIQWWRCTEHPDRATTQHAERRTASPPRITTSHGNVNITLNMSYPYDVLVIQAIREFLSDDSLCTQTGRGRGAINLSVL